MLTKIYGGRKPLVHFHFDNGNVISIVWGSYTYSDNYDVDRYIDGGEKKGEYESTTVEIMIIGNSHPAFVKWFEQKYGENPGGYITVSNIPAILKRADSKRYKRIDLLATDDPSQVSSHSDAPNQSP